MKALSLAAVLGALAVVSHPAVTLKAQGNSARALPAQAAAAAEEEVEGILEVVVEDYATGARVRHGLRVGQQEFELSFDDGVPPGFEHGTRVRVRGRRTNNTLSLKSGVDVQVLGLSASGTFGEQRTLVMLVNFQNYAATPENPSSVWSTTFQTVSEFFRENSYGQTWLTGDVVGYFTLPMNVPGTCDYNTIASQAEQAASNNGVNVSAYPRRVIVFPQIGACGWWGLGNVGGSPTRAWVNGSYQMFVAAHELGHNFGAYHSRSQPCDGGSCSTIEYGDDHDVMGNIAGVHTNAFQKDRLGWLNYGASPPIQAVSSSGTYAIDPMSTPGTYPKALKILKSGTTAGSRTFYYVEARTASGFDGGAPSGVLIHTGSESSGNTSTQIDVAPTSGAYDSILDPGQTFTDPSIGLSITTLAQSAAGATVEITMPGGPSCSAQSPTVTLSPSGTRTTNPGAPLLYDVTVRNNDTTSCASGTFNLGSAVPSGWTGGFDRPSVSMTPGTNGMAVLTVTPSLTASGTSSFTASAVRTGSSGPSGSTSGSISVNAPPPPSGSSAAVEMTVTATATNNRGSVQLRATVLGDSPISGASVSFQVVDPRGSSRTFNATTNTSGVATASVKMRPKDPSGTYTVQVTASWGGETASTTTSFVD